MASGSRENPLQLVQFPFSAGIDEGTRDEVVEAGAGWLVLENGRQDQTGGYSTRTGFDAFASARMDATSPTTGYKLLASANVALRIALGTAAAGLGVEAYDAVSKHWAPLAGIPSECMARLVDVPSLGVGTTGANASSTIEDVAYANGYFAIVWTVRTAASTYYTFAGILNATTFAVVAKPVQIGVLTTSQAPLLAAVGSTFLLALADTAGTAVKANYLDTTSAATITTGWVAMSDLAADVAGGFAICSLAGTSARAALIYGNASAGTNRATVKTFTSAGVLETQTINTSSNTPTFVDCAGSTADTLWLAWVEASTAVKMCGLPPLAITTTPIASTATIITALSTSASSVGIAPGATAGKGRLIVSESNPMATYLRGFKTAAGVAATDGAQITVAATRVAGRPVQLASRYYVPVFAADTSNLQKLVVLVDWTADVAFVRPVACVAPGLANTSLYAQGHTIAGAAATSLYYALGVTKSGVAQGAALAECDFASASRWQPVAAGNSLYLSGGVLGYIDGPRMIEAGFLVRPPAPTVSYSGTGLTGTYRYVDVYEEVDADGNWSQSGVSAPSAVASPSNQTILVSNVPLTVSQRLSSVSTQASGVRIARYRTLTGAVAPYYRLTTIANDTSVTGITTADAVTDTVLAANAKLYSQPGVLGTAQDKRPPPGLSFLVSYNGCLVGASGSDVWYSGQSVSGEGAWFNPVFQVPVPGDGNITAMWVMDGTLFVSKRREMYAITGEAPSDNGSSGGLGLPRRLAVDVGCIESRSVCVTAFGVFFQSDRGIEILTRAQAVQWIGQPVQNTLTAFPIVTSATVEPVSCCVFIELASSQASGLVTGTGRTLVYDLSLQKWVSTDRRRSSAGTVDAPSQSAGMIYTGTDYRYAWIDTTGVVHYGNDTHLDANGSMVAKRAVSPNIRVAGFQGYQHVNKTLVLAKYHTPHDLSMSFAYDYASTYKTARVYTAADLLTLTAALPNMQLEHDMHDDARCEAVRVQLQDVTPSSGTLGTGQGATWIALSFEIVPQTGAYGLPDASR